MQNDEAKRDEINSLLFRRPSPGDGLPLEMKRFILEDMRRIATFDRTLALLRRLQDDPVAELDQLEDRFGPNTSLGMILKKLRVRSLAIIRVQLDFSSEIFFKRLLAS